MVSSKRGTEKRRRKCAKIQIEKSGRHQAIRGKLYAMGNIHVEIGEKNRQKRGGNKGP